MTSTDFFNQINTAIQSKRPFVLFSKPESQPITRKCFAIHHDFYDWNMVTALEVTKQVTKKGKSFYFYNQTTG